MRLQDARGTVPAPSTTLASTVSLAPEGPAPSSATRRLQRRLVSLGFLAGADVSGVRDARTGAALARYQADRGLAAHGIADTPTLDALLGRTDRSIR